MELNKRKASSWARSLYFRAIFCFYLKSNVLVISYRLECTVYFFKMRWSNKSTWEMLQVSFFKSHLRSFPFNQSLNFRFFFHFPSKWLEEIKMGLDFVQGPSKWERIRDEWNPDRERMVDRVAHIVGDRKKDRAADRKREKKTVWKINDRVTIEIGN